MSEHDFGAEVYASVTAVSERIRTLVDAESLNGIISQRTKPGYSRFAAGVPREEKASRGLPRNNSRLFGSRPNACGPGVAQMIDAMAYTVADACRVSGIGKTTLYELLSAGKIEARKAGNKTLITGDSLRAYLAGLPRAKLRTAPRSKAAA